MIFSDIFDKQKLKFNKSVIHPLQSYEWGTFREKTNIKVIRRGILEDKKILNAYTLTIHKIPKINYCIGYLPKGELPNTTLLKDLGNIGMINNCVYIQLEPNALFIKKPEIENLSLKFNIKKSFHPLFTKNTFILDLTKTEDDLLKNMHQKTRYNIKVAQKHNVKIEENTTDNGFNTFLKLYEQTTNRQRFYAHTPSYHRKLFETLTKEKNKNSNSLNYHILEAKYQEKVLTSWVLFSFHDTLYYPYGASSREHRDVMASNLMMWDTILFGKKLGLKKFDMWGALGENPDPTDPWYGFHKFKQGYGAKLTEYVGSYDYVLNPLIYQTLKVADKARWGYLRLKKRIG